MSIGGSLLSLGGLAPNPLSRGYDDMINNIGKGLDRSRKAEQLYGGVDAAGMQVPHFGAQYNHYGRLSDRYMNRGPGSSAFYGDQRGLGRTLAAEAQGNGVGQRLVSMQAQQAADRATAQQFAASAGARPGMQAMAARNAQLGSALAQSAVGEQAALGSAQMTLGAQGQYANFLQGARGQDLQLQGLNDQSQLAALQQRLQLSGLQQQGAMTAEQLRAQRFAAMMGAPTKTEIAMGGFTGLMGSAFGAGGR